MNCQLYWSSYGMGDAIIQAAMIRQLWWDRVITDSAVPVVVFVRDDGSPLGREVFENMTFVDHVIGGGEFLERTLPGEALRYATQAFPLQRLLHLEVGDLKVQPAEIRALLPEKYSAVQPSTSMHKHLVVGQRDTAYPPVLVGSARDVELHPDPWPGALDLRGRLSAAESMWVVANAQDVLGPESWGATLGAMIGLPSKMLCTPQCMRDAVPHFQQAWKPCIEFEQFR